MQINIAIIGYGTVGKSLYQQAGRIPEVNVKKVLVRDPEKTRDLDDERLTFDVSDILKDPSIAIVLEAIDDESAAFQFAKGALKTGKTFISASKKMVANNLQLLRKYELIYGGQLLYEAAVCGSIPILRVLNEHLTVEPVKRIRGVVNGSCNYILDKMYTEGVEFESALAEAQSLGYAESEPSLDIDGWDSYYKSILLSEAAFHRYPDLNNISWQGIRSVTLGDIVKAKKSRKKIKLIVEIEQQQGRVKIDIAPRLITAEDPLYEVDGVKNAVIIYSAFAEELALTGPGAGGDPTASAMVGDLITALRVLRSRDRKAFMSMH